MPPDRYPDRMSANGDVGRAASASFGKYELFAKLGSGGMAEVFLALSRGMAGFNKLVVLKRLRPSVAEDGSMITMFLDEARLTARLHHPNIVNTYEVGEHEGSYFIAMEYLEGQPLNKILKNPKVQELITPLMWCHVFSRALAGLHHAHEQRDFDGKPLDIVHRDISPHNIFITYAGETKLVDFGIAKASVNTNATETGILKGKVNYMAPEQVRGDCDRRADLFAVGLTLWEVLAGRGVFRGEAVTVLHRILNDAIPLLSHARPEIEPALEAIVMKALEKDRNARYQTALEFRAALDDYVRSKGETVDEGAVGTAISTMFEDVKENVAVRVRECIAGLALGKSGESAAVYSTGSLPALQLSAATGDYPALANLGDNTSDVGRTPSRSQKIPAGMMASTPPSAHSSTSQTIVGIDSSSALASRQKTRVGAFFLAVALIGGVAFLMIRPKALTSQESLPAKVVRVVVESDPPGAVIEREGQFVGHTPATLDLSVGPQRLTLVHEGFASQTLTLDVVEGEKKHTVTLVPNAPLPTAQPSVAIAPVSPSGPKPGPIVPSPYTPPAHVRLPTHPPGQPSTPEPASTNAAQTEKGFLSFSTSPWTRVSEGGRGLGTTPLSRVPMTAGPHVLMLDNPDENIHTTYTVVIKPGEAVSRNVELK